MCRQGPWTSLGPQVSRAAANAGPVRHFAEDRVMNGCCPALQHSRPAEDARVRQLQYAKLQRSCDSCVFTGCRNAMTYHSSWPKLANILCSRDTSGLPLVWFQRELLMSLLCLVSYVTMYHWNKNNMKPIPKNIRYSLIAARVMTGFLSVVIQNITTRGQHTPHNHSWCDWHPWTGISRDFLSIWRELKLSVPTHWNIEQFPFKMKSGPNPLCTH